MLMSVGAGCKGVAGLKDPHTQDFINSSARQQLDGVGQLFPRHQEADIREVCAVTAQAHNLPHLLLVCYVMAGRAKSVICHSSRMVMLGDSAAHGREQPQEYASAHEQARCR